MKSRSRGFTLIELLVVIAIIGLLASIILASLNSARSKGGDAAIQGDLDSTRDQAEIVYSNATPNSYSGVCTDPTIVSALNSAQSAGGTGAYTTAIGTAAVLNATASSASGACHVKADNSAYAIEMPLKTSSLNAWCVDNTGKAEQTATALAASVSACP